MHIICIVLSPVYVWFTHLCKSYNNYYSSLLTDSCSLYKCHYLSYVDSLRISSVVAVPGYVYLKIYSFDEWVFYMSNTNLLHNVFNSIFQDTCITLLLFLYAFYHPVYLNEFNLRPDIIALITFKSNLDKSQ